MRRLLRGGLGALVVRTGGVLALQVGGAACAFGFSLVLTRTLGAREAGVYFLALTVASVAAVIGRLGLDQVIVRFAAAETGPRMGGLYRSAGGMVALGTVAVAGALMVAAPSLGRLFGDPELVSPMRWMGAALIATNAASVHGQFLKGIGRVRDGVFADAFLRPALLLVGFGGAGVAYGAEGATVAYVAAGAGAALVAGALWQRHRPPGDAPFPARVLRRTALPLYGVDLLLLATQWAPTLLLGIWSTSADVALLSVAARLVMLAGFAQAAVNAVVAPQIAAAYGRGDGAGLRRTAGRGALLFALTAAPLLAAYAVAPVWSMGWFGDEFVRGAPALVVLAVGQLCGALAGPTGPLLMMTGGEREAWRSAVFGAVGAVLVGAATVAPYGVLGAALAGAAAAALSNAYALVAVRRHLGFWAFNWSPPSEKPGRSFSGDA